MDRSLWRGESKPQATAGNPTQLGLPILCAVGAPRAMDARAVSAADFSGVLAFALMQTGMDDSYFAERLHISKGYMSRFVREAGEAWAKRLVRFMRETESLGPLQWIAHQMGCEVVQRSSKEAEIAALEQQIAELRRAA